MNRYLNKPLAILTAYSDGYDDGRKSVLVGLDKLRSEQKKAVKEADEEFNIQPGQNIGRLGRVLLDRMSRIEHHLGMEAGALKTAEGLAAEAGGFKPQADEKSGLPPLPKAYLPTAPSPAPRPPKPPEPKYKPMEAVEIKGNPLDFVTPLKAKTAQDAEDKSLARLERAYLSDALHEACMSGPVRFIKQSSKPPHAVEPGQ